MKKYLLSLMALAVGLSSCNNNLEEATSLSGNNDVITANMEISDSRTSMNGSSVVWSANDAIGIFIGTANNPYNLKSGDGTITGEFESAGLQVSTAGVKEYAYFPYVATATISGGVISTTLPETYVYSENSNNNAVMAAKVGAESQSAISFKNAGALYAVTVENIPAGYNKAVLKYLNASDNVGIAGAATISFGQDGTPTLAVADATDAASAKKTVTVTFTSSNEPTTKTFYFPMPVKTTGYANQLQFSLESDNSGSEAKSAPVFTKEPERNKLYAVTLKLDVVSGSVVTETANAEAANEKLAKDEITSVSINQVAANDEITIPAKSEESAEKPHSIDLSNATLPASGTVSIVVEEAAPSDAVKATVEELTVIVPEGTSASSLTIDAPGTTVTIQSEDGTVIETLTATTAQNTLVIGKGVTVNSLTVKAGNVRVEEGGKILAITNNTGGVLYITNEGGELPEDLSDKNIIVLTMTDGVCKVSTNEELASALSQNVDKIQLQVLESGYTLPSVAKGKTFTLIGTEGVKINVQSVQNEGLDYSLEGSTVTFEGIEIVTVNGNYKGFARPKELTFNNCTFQNTYSTYGSKQIFNKCIFNISGDKYNLWTWGCDAVVLETCTFNSDGKALLLYGGAGKDTSKNTFENPTTALTVNNCTFNDNGGLADLKAAIEIGNDYKATYVLTVNNAKVNGYEINDKGISTGTTLWANKNSMGKDKLNVIVDGEDVY